MGFYLVAQNPPHVLLSDHIERGHWQINKVKFPIVHKVIGSNDTETLKLLHDIHVKTLVLLALDVLQFMKNCT